jgi:hypothetical protein
VPRRSIAVHADLALAHGPGAIRIRSIDVDVSPTLCSLAATGLAARVRILGRTVLRLGFDRRTTVLGRALDLAPETGA